MKATALGVLFGVLVASAAGLWGGRSASADGGPHVYGQSVTTDACAGCHRAHTAQAANLLKVSETTLCNTCHDGSGATTIVDRGVTSSGGALKAGGFTEAWMNTQDPTWSGLDFTGITRYGGGATSDDTVTVGVSLAAKPVKSKHSTDGSAQTVWGNDGSGSPGFAGFTLKCTSCHDPHGNGNYRVLRPAPASYGGAIDRTAAVNVTDDHSAYATTNYFTNGPGSMTAWCTQCHTRYLASTWPVTNRPTDGIFTFQHVTSAPGAPGCVKCHAAHGSPAASSGYASTVPWPGATGAPTDPTPGGGRLLKMDNRGICLKCHYR